ncbi:hypothetical protein HPB48_001758 [Haemaphysalis longicornis]|uniref:Fucosyltransferase N-terminal domain-containing protein n=1 Tax=Haemaphysalis longicornis TaxID=44386 RepID=A0A9J6GLZ7_HAELO|nr:hypothetical protein HPB48_001758 [Haemaphysalis longicornis]
MQETAAVSVRVRPRFVVATGLALACALYISQHILEVQHQPPSMTSHVNGSKTPFQRIRFTATSRVGEDARTAIYFRGTAVPNTPVILIWTKLHEYQYTFFLKKPSEELNYTGCPKRCRIIDDRSKLSISDGVVFHGKDINVSDMPRTRLQHQKWVYWSAEPPPLSFPDSLKQLNDTFNWTMSYR